MARKKEKSVLPLLIGAIGFGLAAALLTMFYLKSERASILASLKGPEYRNVQVVVASEDLPKGTVISADYFAMLEMPENYVHEDAVTPEYFEQYEGRSLTENLGRGKTLLRSFMDESFPVDFSDIIPKGRRAMTISVDDINSIAGAIRPGNRIDLLVNIPISASGFSPTAMAGGYGVGLPESIEGLIPANLYSLAPELVESALAAAVPTEVIIPVVQNVRVLATGKDAYSETLDELRQPQRRRESTFTTLTLDVSVEEAALLTTAQDKGEMLALLRNRGDDSGAEFTSVSSRDLFSNAQRMAREEQKRKAAASVAAGVDKSGNLVNASGETIMSKEQLAAAGLTVNENGQLVDKDGNVVDPADVIVAPDGSVMTRQQLAEAGYTVNENGEIVDASGKVVDANDIVVTEDGTIVSKQQLAAAGLRVNENGEIVDASGKLVDPADIIVASDGTVMSKAQLAAAGLTVNENGDIVDKDGNVVSASDIIVAADGSVISKQELAKAGLSVNEKGEIVDKNGNVVSNETLASALGRPELATAGDFRTAEARATAAAQVGGVIASGGGRAIDMIIGGASEEGVNRIGKLPVNE